MKREEIENILKQNDSSVLSFKDRGPWGDNKYRGNCSGYVQAYLIWKYQVQRMAELFAGSGTGYDVCQDMKIGYFGADLNPNPVRPNICCLDAFVDEVPEAFSFADFVFMHPPYGTELRIPYAGKDVLLSMLTDVFVNDLISECKSYCPSAGEMTYKVLRVILQEAEKNDYISEKVLAA